MKSCALIMLALIAPGTALAQTAPDVSAPPPAAPPPAAYDPWLAPPGSQPPAPTIEAQAAAVAIQAGIGPQSTGLMLQFFRPRRIGITRSPGVGYVFTVGDVQRVATETAFIDSFVALTG